MRHWKHIRKALALLPVLFFMSCASYNQQVSEFYTSLEKGDYEKASKSLDHNRLLKKNRNRLLYLLEKGKIEHLRGNYKASNRFFEEADLLMESSRTSVKDVTVSMLINPMMETYRGEDFEKYMVHYYKAINYLQMNELEEALVEARRISLRTYAQEDVRGKNKYAGDAFSHMLQGLIYEAAGDVNNAFIAYRNAVDLYLEQGGKFYGTHLPEQLKKDLLRMAWKNGFTDELERYQRLLDLEFDPAEAGEGGLILFWENGMAPVKREQQLFFNLYQDGDDYFFRDPQQQYRIPFDHSYGYDRSRIHVNDIHTLKVTIPRYEVKPLQYASGQVYCNGKQYQLETAQNINELALLTLQERWLKELSKTLTRLAIRKLAEEAAKAKEDEKDEKKKNRKDALALGIRVFGIAAEKADTRNWQSLPHSIYYSRIPLQSGKNQISFQPDKGQERTFELESRSRLQFLTLH